jgi:hypothetical protein
MKIFATILFPITLILALSILPNSRVYACGNGKEYSCKKETKQVKTTKAHCDKQKSSCHKGKNCGKNCTGNCSDKDCQCTVPVALTAEILPSFYLKMRYIIVLENTQTYYYSTLLSNSTFNDIWQPPITVS